MNVEDIVDIELLSVTQRENVVEVERRLVFSDGTTMPGKHVFPADTLEWRAAEYEIDPSDLDTLLDIVLWEPFLGEDNERPDLSLYEAPTIEAARARHLERIQKRKGKSTKRRAGVDTVREELKQMAFMHPEALDLKKQLRDQSREVHRQMREQAAKAGLRSLVQPTTPDDRIKRLRDALGAPSDPSRNPRRSTPNRYSNKETKNG